MKLTFVGSGAFGIPALRALVQSDHTVALVVSQPDRPAGRKKKLTPCVLAAAAESLSLPILKPDSINRSSARDRLIEESADVFVVVSFGQILRQAVLDIPTRGCLNIHGSLLPRHRGASPIQGAILSGDQESGVTIMMMDAGLDTGPTLATAAATIEAQETAGSLHDRLAELAAPLLLQCLADLEAGTAEPVAQDDSLATLTTLITKEDGRLRWEEGAEELDRRIRAMTPWPGAFTDVALADDRRLRLIIESAHPVQGSGAPGTVCVAEGDELVIATGRGALRVLSVKPAGKGSMGAGPFLRGYPLTVGRPLLGDL